MEVDTIIKVINGGGVLAIAVITFWELRQLRPTLGAIADALVRLDERTKHHGELPRDAAQEIERDIHPRSREYERAQTEPGRRGR